MGRARLPKLALSFAALLVAACSDQRADGLSPSRAEAQARDEAALAAVPRFAHKRVCDAPAGPGMMACHARVRVDAMNQPLATTAPQGLTPADLQSAYQIPSTPGAGLTIAVVDAMNDPDAAADLATYRAEFGLPACTIANGCLKIVNQVGESTPLPANDTGWAGEIMLDLSMASAACPSCKLLLVEASSASLTDLGTAVNTAAALGANVISNSYGGTEAPGDLIGDTQYFNHPGVGIFFSAGDDGYGAQYPAASPYVTAVGGTTLVKSAATARGWTEAAWGSAANSNGGTGSGCSKYESKPSWQKDTGCSKRMIGDVSAVGDPDTGVAVYDRFGSGGWAVFGGSSAATPLVAGIFAVTGHSENNASFIYANTTAFYDVTTGTNGVCSPQLSYFCNAGAGYDGPTGWGAPDGAALANIVGGGAGGSGGSSGGNTCAHGVCATGAKLESGCNLCATHVCNHDDYCCAVRWDSICVAETSEYCPLVTCN